MKKTIEFSFSELESILKERVKPNHRNFLYLASGRNPERLLTYLNLPYDNVFLVDKSYIRSEIHSGKVYNIKADASQAVEIFKKAGIKMDFFSSIQEGIYEGGAEYALCTNAYYGFVLPILKDRYIHFLHSSSVKNISRLPFENMTKISPEHDDYINPELITSHPHSAEFWINETRTVRSHLININKIRLKILHKSIWEDFDELELVFSRMDETMKSKLHNSKKIIDFRTHWRNDDAYLAQCNDLLQLCNEKQATTIGMIPFGWGDYGGFLKWLETAEFHYTKEIRLYHLAKNDFKNLYSIV